MYKEEIWEDIQGYEGLYQISNYGRVKSLAREWITGKNTHRKHPEQILKPSFTYGISTKKYFTIGLRINEKSKTFRICRLVAIHFVPNPENKPEVNHIDTNTENDYYENLEWNTKSENIIHAYKNNLIIPTAGERNGMVKLTKQDVLYIRKNNKKYCSTKELANKFGISQQQINRIIRKTTWKHI